MKTLKDRKEDMICLGGLVTRPSKQKRGYGSALVRVVAAKVSVSPGHLGIMIEL
jgi:predicted N-acetyltransferase YhbS